MENDPFQTLGVQPHMTEEEIRAAYRKLVKRCHPDQFQDAEEQRAAQEELIRLNLAYEEALRFAAKTCIPEPIFTPEEIKRCARGLMAQGHFESALRQLARASAKDADWFYLQGELLMRLKHYDTAHQSFREAVRREPENRAYREAALEAAVAMKKRRPLGRKLQGWVQKNLKRR